MGVDGGKRSLVFLVTAGHYGVLKEDLHRPRLSAEGELNEDQVLSVCDGFGVNAGAILTTATSFDTWPMHRTWPGSKRANTRRFS
jgi:hypothetical protein